MRQTLPSIVESILPPLTPEQLYGNFSSAVQDAGKDIRDFTVMMQEGKIEEIFKKAKESSENDGEEIGCWSVEEHANWQEPIALGRDDREQKQPNRTISENSASVTAQEEPEAIIERFRARNPGIEVSKKDDMNLIKVGTIEGRRATDANHWQAQYTVACEHAFSATT